MHALQNRFVDFIETHNLLDNNDRVVATVSGGVDSMVMLRLLQDMHIEVVVAHCNFQLRGAASDADEQLVKNVAEAYGLIGHFKSIPITGKNVQLEARRKRYEWFQTLCDEQGYTKIATAHHLNDTLETTLLNLARGTGINGLAGIPVINAQIIRPLLFATRKEIEKYATDMELTWREDSSNKNTYYNRNKIRHHIIPTLEEINPSLEQTFMDTKERLEMVQNLVLQLKEEINNKYFDEKTGRLATSWITQSHDTMLLAEILMPYGYNYVTVKEIIAAIEKPGKIFPSQDYQVTIDRDSIFIRKKQKKNRLKSIRIEAEGKYEMADGSFLRVSITSEKKYTADQNTACLSFDSLSFPLIVRVWETGDTFRPLGMKGRKSVSDFLTNKKIASADKKDVRVIEHNGEIIWVMGQRISEKHKITSQTQTVLKLAYIENLREF